jgi:peptide/nickel transport system substrate-binding protein/oligopeptide transport system substrate-binding protein
MKPFDRTRRCIVLLLVLAALPAAAQSPDTFVINFLPTEIGYNPLVSYTTSEAQLFAGIYEGLVTYDPFSLDPIPALASRWEISDDGRRYRFTIRPDARYSNGDPILASDFRDTWLRLLDPDTSAAYASLMDIVVGASEYRTGEQSDPATVGIRAISDRVLEVRLEQRATHFLRILCHHSFVPVHASLLESGGWDEPTSIPTSGPYVVSSADETAIVLTENPEYWDRRRIEFDEVRIAFSDDYEAVTAAFNDGEIDWVRGGFDLQAVERTENIVINPLFATTYYQLSAVREPFDDPRVRRAMALLLPWEEIRSEELWYVPANTLVPELPSYPGAEGIVAADRKEALSLLEDAGYPGGRGMPSIVISIPTPLETDVVAQRMIESWEEALEVDVEVDVVGYPGYFEFVDRESFMVSTMSWIGDFADPLTFLDMWTTGSNLNNSRFSNDEYDRLIRTAMGMIGDERYETLSRAEEILLNDGIVLPISHSPSINLINLGLVDGWYPNPLDIHPLKFMSPASGRPLPNVAVLSTRVAPRAAAADSQPSAAAAFGR